MTRLTVENADGARFPSPQKMLDSLLGSLTFDPLAFSRADDKKQVDMLSKLCGLDMAAVEREHKTDFDARTGFNRTAKSKRAAADAMYVPADTPDEPISVAGIVQQVRDAEARNRELENERGERERGEAHAGDLLIQSREAGERQADIIARGEAEIHDVEERIAAARRRMDVDAKRSWRPRCSTCAGG